MQMNPIKTMPLAWPHKNALLEQLMLLTDAAHTPSCLCVRAIRSHLVKAVEIHGPALILPLLGTKRVRETDSWFTVRPGEMLLIPGPRALDMENIPDEQAQEYRAIGVMLDDRVLETARSLLSKMNFGEPGPALAVPLDDLVAPLLDWSSALLRNHQPLACHAMLGVLLRLFDMGQGGLLTPGTPNLSGTIRRMIEDNPAHEWSSNDIEMAMSMSGATLRRRVAAEGTSLRDIITGARLAHALSLLQSTRLPVKTIAQRVGYSSVSSFSKRFSERYGVEPSRVSAV